MHHAAHSTQLVDGLHTLAGQRSAVDLQVPVELLRYLDDGGNPDAFTTEMFSRAHADNQQAKGRVDALRCVPWRWMHTHCRYRVKLQEVARHA